MADTNAMADIRGLDIDKLAKGFAEEELVLRKFLTNSKTSAREIRWYQKTAGFLDSVDTTAITASQIANMSSKARPVVVEQSWTRCSSYIRKYFVESPWLSEEDIKDSDVDILATNVRDLVRAVQKQVDSRIYTVLSTGTGVQTAVCYGTGWDDGTNGNPVADILSAKAAILDYSYNPEGAVMYINQKEQKNLLNWLITTKGSSIPSFAAARVQDGVVMNLLGVQVVVSNNATTDQVLIFVPQRAATYKEFMPISTAVVKDEGIGRKIRVWEEGECLLTDPKAVVLLTSA